MVANTLRVWLLTAALLASLTVTSVEGVEKSPAPLAAQDAAKQVDDIIKTSLKNDGKTLAPLADDQTFLRRVMLDLTGAPPTVSDLSFFSFDASDSKREAVINDALKSPEYSRNWARYWRDVIFSRATDERTRRFQGVFENWMEAQLREGKSWSEITTSLLTATGDVAENGATALVMVHGGDPQEIAAETSRIFLGIQIQCANCHDHPTDSWKRADFHELAAFFPRIQFRQIMDGDRRTFEVASLSGNMGRGNRPGANFLQEPERLVRTFDRNRDGKLTKREVGNSQFARFFDRILENADTDKDQAVTAEELKKMPAPMMPPGRGSPEYFMPDLNDPSSRGTQVDPVFFVSKTSAPEELGDIERRTLLAELIVSPENEWFAKAFVNRMWSELTGSAFYTPIDDIGPERQAEYPEALDLLAEQFTANNYDIRWLLKTIVSTQVYQRSLSESGEAGFVAATPTRLRGDSLYDSFAQALGIGDRLGEMQRGNRPNAMNARFAGSPRARFGQLFEYDPSTPKEDLTGTIPQALFLMNSNDVERAIQAEGFTKLGQILRTFPKDDDVIRELYLTVLTREPSAKEISLGKNYLAEVKDRNEAFEDLYWALLNSSEFLNKR